MKVKFVKKESEPGRHIAFDQIMKSVSEATQLKVEVIKTIVERSFIDYGDWSLNYHYLVTYDEKKQEIEKVLRKLRQNFRGIIESPQELDRAVQIAEPAVDLMFEVKYD